MIPIQLKSLPIPLPHINREHQALNILKQRLQLIIILPLIVRNDRHPIKRLVRVRVGRVVHEDHPRHGAVDYAQVFYVDPLWGAVAALAE